MCEVEGCDKEINKSGLCLRHKLLSVNIGTVPGGARAARTGLDYGRKLEANLHRYRDRKQAGDNPSGITDESYREDRRKEQIMEEAPHYAHYVDRWGETQPED